MFLWLKLLAFGLALVNMVAAAEDQPTATPSPSPSPSPSADDTKNSSSHISFTPSTGTSSSISQAPTISPSIGTTTPDCNLVDQVSLVNYTRDNFFVTANLNGYGLELEKVACGTEYNCIFHKNTISNLSECSTIQLYFLGCTNIAVIPVPPVGRELQSDSTNTTVTLHWAIPKKFKCRLTYNNTCHLPDHIISSKETLENLLPNRMYICTSQMYLEDKLVNEKTIQVKTDYGNPGEPENVTESHNSTSISINWEEPTSKTNGPINGYIVCISKSKPCPVVNETRLNSPNYTTYSWHNLASFQKYHVYVWAYTMNRDQKRLESKKISTNIFTDAAKPTPVNNIKSSLSDTANNEVRINCTKPDFPNGPDEFYVLNEVHQKEIYEKKSTCVFNIQDLSFLTGYNFSVTYYNGVHYSEPVYVPIKTGYNSKALIIFLAFLIIVTSLALLLVLYKIYILNREKSRNADESVVLVPTDYEKNLMNIDPIPAESLWEAYKRKIADEGRLFLDEFQSIPRVFTKFSIKEARKSYNQNKNRYVDILPYDYNRVELSGIAGDPGSDYINASHIDGFKEPRKYIAAQGPKDETTDDFWRMIWEQKATIVVMVTRCEEGNRIKCAKYWPSMEEETASYGDIVVKINESKVCPDYNIQKLHITNRREKTTGRDVTHIQFTSWPDHGVPDDPHLLLKLRRRVNALSNFFSGPIVVHCSAGVGRTGTYIGIDAMLEGLETEGRVDVYGYVVKLRRQRCLMVQVETQYILIHQALVDYIQYGETEVSVSELCNYLHCLKKRDPPSDPSLLEAEFQRLPAYKNWQSQRTGSREENKSKNRSSAVIPYDYNRVLFRHEEEGSRESDHDSNESSDEESDCEEPSKYINASYITGYWLQNAMIATQGPLAETIGDFWNMIYQKKVKVIVMLTELKDETQELCAQYWGDGKQTYDGLTVELKDTNCCSSYTIRVFDLTHTKRKETRKVFQYQYQKWKGFALPENPSDLITMIQNLKQKLPSPEATAETKTYNKNVPLVVHCRDGSQQTGIFCALMNLLDCAETEGVIDVFQVVKGLRRARSGMVVSFEDYEFLYDTVASMYPAQNGQLQKSKCQEHKVDIEKNVEKENEADSVKIDLSYPVQETRNDAEMQEDSKAKDDSREAESSSNGPTNPVLMDIN
ncbi:receptor-type tyrosine-protein phosphatase C isoform X2 [Tiliqua scincoides]|uniref:receptor-type tyrosine-protein phosphatase C isoform X2 n=1 Tax=Tiliqua scincoides TaxID=71010 RepID=UPI0034623F8A